MQVPRIHFALWGRKLIKTRNIIFNRGCKCKHKKNVPSIYVPICASCLQSLKFSLQSSNHSFSICPNFLNTKTQSNSHEDMKKWILVKCPWILVFLLIVKLGLNEKLKQHFRVSSCSFSKLNNSILALITMLSIWPLV